MPRILLTEDQEDQRTLYHDVLTEAGYEVCDACNASEALKLFQRNRPDIIILDIQMPGMDSLRRLERLSPKTARFR